jgi:putative nucleotidyltransferase with HDIG domain
VRRRFGIVGTFAVWSGVVTGVFAVGVSVIATQQVAALTVEASARSLTTAMNVTIVRALTTARLDALSPSEMTALDSAIKQTMESGDVRAVKIWSTESRVVYSSYDQTEIGKRYEGYANVDAALAGEVAFDSNTSDKDESEDEARAFGDVIEVYAPMVAHPDGKIIGVFEVYQNYGPIRDRLVRKFTVVWGLSLLAAVLLYLVQLRVVKYAADRLHATEGEVSAVNDRLLVSLRDLEEHSMGTLQALVSAVDAKDSYTARHSLGVTEYAIATARRMGLGNDEVAVLERAGLLHDIGKIGIPESVLLKPGALSDEEYLTVKEHSDMGSRIIESIPFLRDLVGVVRHHHERWDGKGYPDGLAAEEIPRLSRILTVADAFEAMTSDRPYRRGMPVRKAREELERNNGTQFDPAAVAALLEALDAGEVGPDESAQDKNQGMRSRGGR